MRCIFVLVTAVAVMLATGCASTMAEHMNSEDFVVSSSKLKGAKIDVEASEIHWKPETLIEYAPGGAQASMCGLRADMADGFDHALVAGDGKPARFRVTVVDADISKWMVFAPCLVILSIFGCPVGLTSATVEVELEVDGKVYKDTGESSGAIFLFSDDKHFPGEDVASAVIDALRKIDGAR